MNESIRVVLVEDEPLFADLMYQSLAAMPGIEIMARLDSGRAAAAFEGVGNCDVAVIDIDLGDQLDGVEIARLWRTVKPALGVVFLSNLRDPAVLLMIPVEAAVGTAYLHKRSAVGVDRLVEVIAAVSRGEVLIDPVLTSELPTRTVEQAELTAHQERILRLIATGASNKRIAEDLNIPIKSVENATAAALRALGIDGTDPGINVRVSAAMAYIRMMSGVR